MNRQTLILVFCFLLSLGSLAQTTYSKKNVSLKVKLIVHRLNKYEEVSGALIGKAPQKPKQYGLFEKLKSKANESELFELTNHPNPTVRAYAYWGLVEMNSSMVLKVILKNQSDTLMITYKYGCTGKEKRLIEFMTGFVGSYAEKNNITLTAEVNAIIQREKDEWYKRELKPIEDRKRGQ
jgi:hypothetical protein